jgi:hypothetical protein
LNLRARCKTEIFLNKDNPGWGTHRITVYTWQLPTLVYDRRGPSRVQLKYDGTRWHKGGEVKGKLANGVGSQYPSHYLGTWCIQHYYRWWRTPRLPVVDWTGAPADLNGLFRFAERRNMVSARVPSHFNWPLRTYSGFCVPVALVIQHAKRMSPTVLSSVACPALPCFYTSHKRHDFRKYVSYWA